MIRGRLFAVVNFITILNYVCLNSAHTVAEVSQKFQTGTGNDLPEIESELRLGFKADVIIPTEEGCKCGDHSKNCEFKDGFKICSCEEGFVPGNNEMCTEMCNDTHKCLNGGTCHERLCLCPPRTDGAFCEKINFTCSFLNDVQNRAALGLGCCCLDKTEAAASYCTYDVNKHDAFCKCPEQGHVYDDNSKSCKECNCGKMNTWTNCEFINKIKTCSCMKNYEYNPKTQICEPCNCGDGSNKCEFSWYGNINCNCFDGYQQWENTCQKCDCGLKGSCILREGKPICHCDKGSQELNGTCLACVCGKYGQCVFNAAGENESCQCDTGYSEYKGECRYCYCGDGSICSYNATGEKNCQCPAGHQDVNGFCEDIDECEEPNICPPNEKCINLRGFFACSCADGYIHTDKGCTDINECLTPNRCSGSDKECVNTPGSYICMCKSGYLKRGGAQNYLICEGSSAVKVGYGVLTAIFASITIGLLIILYRKYRYQR